MFDVEALKSFIEASGLKQKAIAERCGISETALSQILNGKRRCGVDEAIKICRFSGADIKEFLR